MKTVSLTLVTKRNENIKVELNIKKICFMETFYFLFIGESGGYKSSVKVHGDAEGTIIHFSDRFKIAVKENVFTILASGKDNV